MTKRKRADPVQIAEAERLADSIVEQILAENVSPQERRARVAEVEHELGVEFPASYTAFLAKNYHLTLMREPTGFYLGDPTDDPDEFEYLEYLFTVGTGDKFQELLPHAKWYQDWLPPNLITIGTVVNKDLVCIVVDGEGTGEIHFFKSDGEIFVSAGKLANNIDEFMESLFEI